jgi:hypothetical protein
MTPFIDISFISESKKPYITMIRIHLIRVIPSYIITLSQIVMLNKCERSEAYLIQIEFEYPTFSVNWTCIKRSRSLTHNGNFLILSARICSKGCEISGQIYERPKSGDPLDSTVEPNSIFKHLPPSYPHVWSEKYVKWYLNNAQH